MKVIFFDYDGVLNKVGKVSTPVKIIGGTMTVADPELVFTFNRLVDRTGAEIVISSSWRHMPEWREIMRKSGIVKSILDRTPNYSDHKKYGIEYDELCRGHNIQDWIDEHDVDKYAIIDDTSDMIESQQKNFFQTVPELGLTREIADRIERHLLSSDTKEDEKPLQKNWKVCKNCHRSV